MTRRSLKIALSTLAIALTLGTSTVFGQAADQSLEIKRLTTRVRHVDSGEVYNYELGQHIPLQVGERVVIRLRGEGPAIRKAIDLRARWEVNRGGWRLDVLKSQPDFIELRAVSSNEDNRGKNGNLSQLEFTLQGPYTGRKVILHGFLTFDIGGSGHGGGGGGDLGGGDSSSAAARAVVGSLYHGILGRAPSSRELSTATDRVDRYGVGEVRTLAANLAADARAPRGDRWQSRQLIGDLYRALLGRTGTDQQMWDRDQGFRDAVSTFMNRGLSPVVDVLVTSEEFRRHQGLDRLAASPPRGVRRRN
ncbi:MAG: hypothetical protein AAF604_08880 [Acidobacteriota bacterium]